MNSNIWEGGDDLLLRRKVGALLELEITNGTGKGEVAVDTAEVNETTSGTYPGFLACYKSVC